MNALLVHLALLLCPADFRHGYRERFLAEGRAGAGGFALALDLARTGLTLRSEMFVRDLSQALRSLRKMPVFTSVALLAIALAIGANLIVACILGAVVLRPLPYAQPDRLLFVHAADPQFGGSMTYPQAQVLAQRMRERGEIAISASQTGTLSGKGHPIALQGLTVSSNYFDVLGLRPALGRFFTRSSQPTDVVISYHLWQSTFGADPAVLGSIARIAERPYRIVGVAPAGFLDPDPRGLGEHAYWIPVNVHDTAAVGPGDFQYVGIARVRPGVDIDQASRDIMHDMNDRSIAGLVTGFPSGFYNPSVERVSDVIVGRMRPLLWSLYAAVSFVLLIACINIANLHIARQLARAGRVALLSAIGATNRRMAVELATETTVLATVGGVIGVGIAVIGLAALSPILGPFLPFQWQSVRVDGALLIYAAALVPCVTLAAGILPALAQRNASLAVRSSSQSGERRSSHRVRASLIIVEVSLAMTLAICAGLVFRSFLTLTTANIGFDPTNIVVVHPPTIQTVRYASDMAKRTWALKVAENLRSVPGVTGVAIALQAPFTGDAVISVFVDGRQTNKVAGYNPVGRDYFRLLHIPLIRGRVFTAADDRPGSAPVAVVDAAFARRFFGTLDVLGHKVTGRRTASIVGVVSDVKRHFHGPAQPTFYLPLGQDPDFKLFVVQLRRPLAVLLPTIDAAFDRVDSTLPSPQVRPLESYMQDEGRYEWTSFLLFAILAGIALTLSLTGVYAVSANAVEQRRREFGIRKALGATTGNVLRVVVLESAKTSILGITIGVVLTAIASHFLGELLYETSPWDPMTYLSVASLFLLCAMTAACVPALRAMQVDPAVALRSE